MKNFLVFTTIFSLFLFACSGESSDSTETETETVEEEVMEETPETSMETTEASETSIPEFENEALTEYVEEFDVYLDEMIMHLEAGDEAAIEGMKDKEKALQEKGEALKDDISEEDQAKMEAYMKERMQSLFAIMMQGAEQ